MGKITNHSESATRQHLLRAAIKCFARRGYAATSVREIVDAARVSKPALYYYFTDKANLFQSVVDSAHDERFQLIQQAAARGRTTADKLEEIVAEVFNYSLRNLELMRLTFATAFAAAGDAPGQMRCREKGLRSFEFIKSLVEAGQASGELSDKFDAEELTMGIYGQVTNYVMVRLLVPGSPLDRKAARRVVQLFIEGASNHAPAAREARAAGAKAREAGADSPTDTVL